MRGRSLLIIIILVPLVVIGVLALYNRGKKSEPPKTSENTEEQPPPAETQNPAAPELLTEMAVISPVLSFDGGTVWFMTPEGKMFRQSLTGAVPAEASAKAEEYSLPQEVRNLVRIVWQQKGSDFIAVQNIAGHVRYRQFDADKVLFIDYPRGAREIVFTADESKVVYDWVTASGAHELKIADKSGQNFRKVMDLARADWQIAASPAKNEIALFADNAVDPAAILLVNLDTGLVRALSGSAPFGGVKFSPDGSKLLVSRAGNLAIIDVASGESVETGIAAEADQATWMPGGTVILSASPAGLVRFNLPTRQSEVVLAQPGLRIREIIVHLQEPVALFVNAVTGKLYRFSF